jgi:arginine/lysine/ornithine decarboxylase
VDNAHGAYLHFLPQDLHPLSLGADMCCDSAHKTLPCLTGAAYLHLSAQLDKSLRSRAEDAMALFGSTSPSYLILQSLDMANAVLEGEFGVQLIRAVKRLDRLRQRLLERGWKLEGEEPLKLTLAASRCGIEGTVLSDRLREQGIECEFSDRDFVTLMPSAWTREEDWQHLEQTLLCLPVKEALPSALPSIGTPQQVCSIREAMLSPSREVPVEDALGRILADAYSGCPPAVPVRIAGERLDREALHCFRYYGITTCRVLCKDPGEHCAQSGG